ncbi:MAG TPA: NAD-dependent deacylase [Cyclobacteriaceae bacterium]|nr:NAD-dependent deacylase [Cyclobacteriaceae bacterium]
MKKLVALTGSGISVESGLKTFRDSDGLWEGHEITEVASPTGWLRNPGVVLEFYNQRRKNAMNALPNTAHRALFELEQYFNVFIITQNVDNLHEKAGSSNIIHLHGELFKARSTVDESLVYELKDWQLNLGDQCEKGSQLRPHIVWFGEMVPMMDRAIHEISSADIVIVVGTSLVVYPAAGLVDYISSEAPVFIVDPKIPKLRQYANFQFFEEKATTGLEKLKTLLIDKYR